MQHSGDGTRRGAARSTEVVVTGIGMTTPLGGDVAETWTALLAGESGTVLLDEPWAEKLPSKLAARLRREPAEVLSDRELRRMDRSEQIALVASREAWADAGSPEVDPLRFAVVIGTGIGGLEKAVQFDRLIERRGAALLTPYAVPMFMPNGAAGLVSIDLGARAGAHAPVSACASGSEAIAVAAALLRTGRADIVLAGGTDAALGRLGMASFGRMGALSRRMDDPAGASRPFDQARDGFVLGEGAGALVLETAEHARARGVRPLARLAGAEVNSDAHDLTVPDRSGQVRALQAVLRDADLGPQDIVHVNAHATGTPLGDVLESEAIAEAIGLHPLLTAPKSCLGHLIGGAGAVEAIITILTIRDGLIPATRNLRDQADEVKHEVVTDGPRRIAVPAALSNSFGFGGHNAVLAFTAV